MIQRIWKRLTALLIGVLLCFTLPSCGALSVVKDALSTLTDKPTDFDRYIEYLNGLEDHEDIYDGYGYLAMAYPVTVQDEQCLNLAGVTNAKGENVDKDFTLTMVLIIPEGGQEIHFGFDFSEVNKDGSRTKLVTGTGTLNAAEYNGSLPAFTDYTNTMRQDGGGEEHYRQMATEEMNHLLTAASVLLGRADLDLSALGFTYTPEEPETNQTVSFQ
ncbi:MAG: hypothetical protein IJ363_07905 [Clostridia bacterium]|nr:hypothetical protein [Clostridia bacterium]